jgi:hypothetical protein
MEEETLSMTSEVMDSALPNSSLSMRASNKALT